MSTSAIDIDARYTGFRRFYDDTASLFRRDRPPRMRNNSFQQSLRGDEDDCLCLLDCCYETCAPITKLCCVGKMFRKRRIQILWLWLVVLTINIVLGIALGLFGTQTYISAATDMRIVRDKVSTLFCESLSLSANSQFSAYVFDSEPEVDESRRQLYKEEQTMYLEADKKQYWGLYLLEGSEAKVSSCADDEYAEFYLIKGQKNLQKWLSQSYCSDCYVTERFIGPDCAKMEDYDHLTYQVINSDNYYFAYTNRLNTAWVRMDLRINRTLYNVDNAIDSFEDTKFCNLPLGLNTDQTVVYHVGRETEFNTVAIESQCGGRVMTYVLFFVLIPLSTGILGSLVIYFCMSDPSMDDLLVRAGRRSRRSNFGRFASERTPLLWGFPRVPATPVQPPKYEDIVRSDQPGPPSYDEATTSQSIN